MSGSPLAEPSSQWAPPWAWPSAGGPPSSWPQCPGRRSGRTGPAGPQRSAAPRSSPTMCAIVVIEWSKNKGRKTNFLLHNTCLYSFLRSNWHFGQSWARDNSVATMWPCYQAIKLFEISILLYLLLLPHWGLTIFQFFSVPLGYITLSRCRCCEVKKLSRAQLWFWLFISK